MKRDGERFEDGRRRVGIPRSADDEGPNGDHLRVVRLGGVLCEGTSDEYENDAGRGRDSAPIACEGTPDEYEGEGRETGKGETMGGAEETNAPGTSS